MSIHFFSFHMNRQKMILLAIPLIWGLLFGLVGGVPLHWVSNDVNQIPPLMDSVFGFLPYVSLFGMFCILPLVPFLLLTMPLSTLFTALFPAPEFRLFYAFAFITILLFVMTFRKPVTKADWKGVVVSLAIITFFAIPNLWSIQVDHNRVIAGLSKPDGQSGLGEAFIMSAAMFTSWMIMLSLRWCEKKQETGLS